MQDLRGSASTGAAKNANRDLQRRLLKRNHWPPPYIQEVTSWSVKQKEEVQQRMAIMLPHEIVGVLSEVSDPEVMCQNAALDGTNMAKHAVIYEATQCPFVSISLWGDGVPFSWDRKQSVEVWTLSFPGLIKKEYRDIRQPCLTAALSRPHRMMSSRSLLGVFKLWPQAGIPVRELMEHPFWKLRAGGRNEQAKNFSGGLSLRSRAIGSNSNSASLSLGGCPLPKSLSVGGALQARSHACWEHPHERQKYFNPPLC